MGRGVIRSVGAVAGFAAAAFLGESHLHGGAAGPPPNIVLIVVDDLGYGDPGCYGGSLVPTPAIDSLAADGARFTDGYVTAPVCAPSRCGLITGAYNQRFGIQRNEDQYRGGGRGYTIDGMHQLLPQALAAGGYVTGHIGKWNVGADVRGRFDDTYDVIDWEADYFPDDTGHYVGVDSDTERASSKRQNVLGPARAGDEYLTDRIGRHAVEFVEKHKDGGKPFFLFLAFNAVHTPFQAKQEVVARFAHLEPPLNFYAALLASLDENIGLVLATLPENTIVALVSDNGPAKMPVPIWPEGWPKNVLAGSAGPLRGHKGQFFEGGVRVPFLLRWPGRVKAGTEFTQPVSTMDLYPTFCAAAGIPIPAGTKLDGVNLLPYLSGTHAEAPHDMLFWKSGEEGAVRRGDWKLVIGPSEPAMQLFNLAADVGEKRDVADDNPEVLQQLHKAWLDWSAPFPPRANPRPSGSTPARPARDATGAAAKPQLNVLFVAVDDLRPEMGCYGNRIIHTPHMDRLAARGVVFNRAYCQQALCSPSRSSIMTGRRPDATRVWDLETHFRAALPEAVTLPQHFKAHGYHCAAFGKVYHGGFEDGRSWSEPHWYSGRTVDTDPLDWTKRTVRVSRDGKREYSERPLPRGGKAGTDPRGNAFEVSPKSDDELPDGHVAAEAIKKLRALKAGNQPFFLAVGFIKPHLPFVAPKKYWDLYNPETIPSSSSGRLPEGGPECAGHNNPELHTYADCPDGNPIPDDFAKKLRHGYYACTSYTDALVGRMLQTLEEEGLADTTAVVFWGDHGWHLGDHGLWGKHTNFECATRASLIISVPGLQGEGHGCDAPVEFVDVYPTLADVCGLPMPAGLDGISLRPWLEKPATPMRKVAISQFPRNGSRTGNRPLMGYSIRDERWRLTVWRDRRDGSVVATELYDEENDPAESVNLAGSNPEVVDRLGEYVPPLPPFEEKATDGRSRLSR